MFCCFFGGFNSFVYALALQSDGKVLVGGDFTKYSGKTVYSGVTANYIIRLNSDGSIDNRPDVTSTLLFTSDVYDLWKKIGYIQDITPTDAEVNAQLIYLDIESIIHEEP